MPVTKRTTLHVEGLEGHVALLRSLAETAAAVTGDGLVTPDEARLLADALDGALLSGRSRTAEAAAIDGGLRLGIAYLHTGGETDWTARLARQLAADEARLAGDGLLALGAA